MEYSFIIPCHNSESTISQCLETILELLKTNPQAKAEIIVINNASTDQTEELVRKYPAKLHYLDQKSRAQARNLGASKATGKYLCFIDSDVLLAKNWLDLIINHLNSSPEVKAIGTFTKPSRPKDSKLSLFNYLLEFNRYLTPRLAADYVFLDTKACVYRRDIFLDLKFDENLKWYEDIDLSRRLSVQTGLIIMAEDCKSSHLESNLTFLSLFMKAFFAGRETPVYYLKWSLGDEVYSFSKVFKRGLGLWNFFYKRKDFDLILIATTYFFFHTLGLIVSAFHFQRRKKVFKDVLERTVNISVKWKKLVYQRNSNQKWEFDV